MAGFPRARRIHRPAEIRAIVVGGRTVGGPNLRLHLSGPAAGDGIARAAVVVPRFGRSAVERNRLRRRLREITRLHLLDAPELAGTSFVVRARAGAYGRRFEELRSELLEILRGVAGGGAVRER